MTTIYVNGKRTTKDELERIELHQKGIKRILAEKMNGNEKEAEESK